MQIHSVKGGGGLNLHVREWGEQSGPPILFIHGWSQSHLCWQHQYESGLADEFRLVALDLRGHGMSDAPLASENYTQAQLWADDIAAIIDRLELDRPVVVAWSYGGFVVCDYLRGYGESRIAGINFVGAGVSLSQSAFGTLIGHLFVDAATGASADDLPTNIEAIRNFVRSFTASPLPPQDHERAICWNMSVPAKIRGALVSREIDSDDVLAALSKPALVSHGESDPVVLPAMGEHTLTTCPTATASWYPDVGHAPFLEAPDRFNRELSAFVHNCRIETTRQTDDAQA